MKEPLGAGLVAGAIAVTAGGGVSIVAEGWPEAALVALAVGERLRPRLLARGPESRGARRGRALVLRGGRGLLPRPRGRPDRRRGGAGDRRGRRPVLRRPRGGRRGTARGGADAMPDLVIAARDAPAADRAGADVVCDGKTDVAVLAKAARRSRPRGRADGRHVRRERRIHAGRQPVPAAGRGRDRPGRRPRPHPAGGREGAVPDRGRRARRDAREPRRLRLRRGTGHGRPVHLRGRVRHALARRRVRSSTSGGRAGARPRSWSGAGRGGRAGPDVPALLGRAVATTTASR